MEIVLLAKYPQYIEDVSKMIYEEFVLGNATKCGTCIGYPMTEPRCMMCQELYEGAMDGITGYIVYDMYYNA